MPGRQEATVRLTSLPDTTTSSEAEYAARIPALVDVPGRIERAGKSLHGDIVVVATGSRLMVGQLTQG